MEGRDIVVEKNEDPEYRHPRSNSIEKESSWMAIASRIPFNQRIQVEQNEFSDGDDVGRHQKLSGFKHSDQENSLHSNSFHEQNELLQK